MDKIRRIFGLGLCLGLLCFLYGCSLGAAEPPMTGVWSTVYEYGDISFTVDPTRTMLTEMNYSVEVTPKCNPNLISGSMTLRNKGTFDPGLMIENNQFQFEDQSIKLEGKFSKSGTSVSGSWEFGTCKGKWEASRE